MSGFGHRSCSLDNTGDDEHEELLEHVARIFQHENALNPLAYPSLMEMELDVVAMATELVVTAHAADGVIEGFETPVTDGRLRPPEHSAADGVDVRFRAGASGRDGQHVDRT